MALSVNFKQASTVIAVFRLLLLTISFWSLFLLMLSGCRGAVERLIERPLDPEKPVFVSYDDTRLFFKNTRLLDYDKQEIPGNKMNVYRHEARYTDKDEPAINLAIADNWLHNEAYLLIEPNACFAGQDTIKVYWQKDTAALQNTDADTSTVDTTAGSGIYVFGYGNKQQHFAFAVRLYQSMRAGHLLFIKPAAADTLQPFMTTEETRGPFRKTAIDYFRIVRAF